MRANRARQSRSRDRLAGGRPAGVNGRRHRAMGARPREVEVQHSAFRRHVGVLHPLLQSIWRWDALLRHKSDAQWADKQEDAFRADRNATTKSQNYYRRGPIFVLLSYEQVAKKNYHSVFTPHILLRRSDLQKNMYLGRILPNDLLQSYFCIRHPLCIVTA